jgi:hypothetical protein
VGGRFSEAIFFLSHEEGRIKYGKDGDSFFGVGAAEGSFPEEAAMGGKEAKPDVFLASVFGVFYTFALDVAGGPNKLVGVFGEAEEGARRGW